MKAKKNKTFKKPKEKWVVILLFAVVIATLIASYVFCELHFNSDKVINIATTTIAIIAAGAFWWEYRQNTLLNEAQFILDLNEQFISNEHLSDIEWELEKFYNIYQKEKDVSEDYKEEFKNKFAIDKKNRQYLVNYLVHLEGIAALVKNKVLKIETINDLMSYRYFIAMNNPIVQELELNAYKNYYQGCHDIYNSWVTVFNSNNKNNNKTEIPMHDKYSLK